jgi:hypothetical protein
MVPNPGGNLPARRLEFYHLQGTDGGIPVAELVNDTARPQCGRGLHDRLMTIARIYL